MDEMLSKEDLRKTVADVAAQFGDNVDIDKMKWERTPQEQQTGNAINDIKKCLKQMRSVDKTKANKLLAGLEAIECDFNAQVEITSVKLHVADSVNLKKDDVSIFDERPLIAGAKDIAAIAKHAQKKQKKIEQHSIKLGNLIGECRNEANAILDAVLKDGLTPEQAVQNAMGLENNLTV